MLAHSQRYPSEPCPEHPGPSVSYLRAPYPQPHSSNPPRLESLTHSPESPHGSSRLHASWVLSSCPYPDLAPQGTSYRHLHSHKLGMPQGYLHTPSALIAHGAHTPMASLAPSLIPLLSRNPAHGSAPRDVLPTCPLTSAPAHSLYTYCVSTGPCMISPVSSSARSHPFPAQSLRRCSHTGQHPPRMPMPSIHT